MDNGDYNLPSQETASNDRLSFELLALRYLDGVHCEADAKLLSDMLVTSAEKREAFAALSVEVGLLGEISLSRMPATSDMNALSQAGAARPAVFGAVAGAIGFLASVKLPVFLMVTMSLLVGVFLGLAWRKEELVLPVVKRSEERPAAAFLMSANGCNWGRSGPAVWNVGHNVQAGDEVALNEGIAEFRLASGAYLGAEGPASLLLASPSTLVLQYGKLTSHVPWGSNELKIVAAGCRIIARDAEFGLSYSNNKLDIHVFSGQVIADSLVAPSNLKDTAIVDGDWATVDGDNCFTDAVITAGRVLQLTVQGELLKVAGWDKAKPSEFISKLSMSGPLNVTQSYVDQVLASQPIGYWRFEQVANSIVPNEIVSGPGLIVKSEQSLAGAKENFSADFCPNGKLYLRSDGKLPLANSDYSIEAWVKPSHLHLGSIAALVAKEGDYYSGSRLELQGARSDSYNRRNPGVVRFHHYRDYLSTPKSTGTSCFSSGDYAMRRWQHIVAVKCGPEMKLYVDGKLRGSTKDESTLPGDVLLHVGVESNHHSRHFIGQMDELAIYNRALSKQDINKHYKALKEAMATPKSTNAPQQAAVKLNEA